jgi:hypothetical protein
LLVALFSLTAVFAQDIGEISVTCPGGLSFTNGIEFRVVQMRAGFDYTATVIGLNGFDPILAVLNEDLQGGLCSDDDRNAAEYGAYLPSTGEVEPSSTSAQVIFNHNDRSGFQDISLVVGGYGDAYGEFLLILEGMATTQTDNAGDAYSVRVTPAMVESESPIIVYALQAFNSQSDPILSRIDSEFNAVDGSDGRPMVCDDAGTDSCWAEGPTLEDFYVSITGDVLPGGQLDAALVQDTSMLELTNDPDTNFINFLVNSYQGNEGQYVLVFHVGSTEATPRSGK